MPVNVTVCVPPLASSTLIAAVRVPVADGVNVTFIVQLACGGIALIDEVEHGLEPIVYVSS